MKLKLPFSFQLSFEAEKWFLILFLLLYIAGPVYPAGVGRFIRIIAYPLIFTLFICHWKQILHLLTRDITLLVMFGLSMIALTWSVAPGASLGYWRGMLSTSILVAYIAVRFSPKVQTEIWAIIFSIWGLLSIVIEIVYPSYSGGWGFTGIFPFKYFLGIIMTLGALLAVSMALSNSQKRLMLIMISGISLVVLLLTKSTTALLAFVSGSILFPFYIIIRLPRKIRFVVFALGLVISLCLAVLISVNIETILIDWLDKDITLTGRTGAWEILIREGLQKPWLGYGQGAFWHTESALDFAFENGFPDLPRTGEDISGMHAHSGYIDLFLSFGFLGLIAFAINFLTVLSRTIVIFFHTRTLESFYMIEILVVMLVSNYSEGGSILAGGNLMWLLYLSVAFSSAIQIENIMKFKLISDDQQISNAKRNIFLPDLREGLDS